MTEFLRVWLPRVLPAHMKFSILEFKGKSDFMRKVETRLKGYADQRIGSVRIIMIVDRDDDDCKELKQRLESIAVSARLRSRTATGGPQWQIVNRIAVEELEAWYFGDWDAVCQAYPNVSPTIPKQKGFRDPEAIRGGTWEAFERVLKNHGYFPEGLKKVEAARAIGAHIDPSRSRSSSFRALHSAIQEALA